MKPQAYQKPTIYNSDGTKAQIGTYDIRTDPLTNSTADGILDYINNNLEALHDKAGNYLPLTGNYLPLSGGTMTGVAKFKTNNNVDVTSNTRVEEVTTQGLDKNNVLIGQDFYSSYAPENVHGIRVNNPDTTTGGWADLRVHATASGKCIITSDRHSNLTDGTTDNTNCIPTTAWLHSHYLPLSGGTLTGVVNGVTPPNDDNSKKLATTEFVANTYATKRDAANTYLDKLSKTEQVVTAPIKGTLNGNAASATKATQDDSGNVIRTTYATKADLKNYYTKDEVDSAIAGSGSGSGSIDLSIYAKKTDLSAYQTKLTFDTAPTANSTNPVTSGGVKSYVDSAIAAGGTTVDLSNYYTKSQVDSAISTAISTIVDGDSKSY